MASSVTTTPVEITAGSGRTVLGASIGEAAEVGSVVPETAAEVRSKRGGKDVPRIPLAAL
jgi:hypothetical protein